MSYNRKIKTKEDAIEELVSLEKDTASSWDPYGFPERIKKVKRWLVVNVPANTGGKESDSTTDK